MDGVGGRGIRMDDMFGIIGLKIGADNVCLIINTKN
jgi:hypothetical protein